MSDITCILSQIEAGDPLAAEQLLPLVYEELRKLAAAKLAQEAPGQTLDATALVHEAYLRLVGNNAAPSFDHRGHFFAAAAEARRRILIDQARRKASLKRGGGRCLPLESGLDPAAETRPTDLLALDEALQRFERRDPIKARLVTLRFFGGMTQEQAAESIGVSISTADRYWAYARAWLHAELSRDGGPTVK
jgi:RNA polymerase sigma factor (TIGR02999 family)